MLCEVDPFVDVLLKVFERYSAGDGLMVHDGGYFWHLREIPETPMIVGIRPTCTEMEANNPFGEYDNSMTAFDGLWIFEMMFPIFRDDGAPVRRADKDISPWERQVDIGSQTRRRPLEWTHPMSYLSCRATCCTVCATPRFRLI